MVQAMQSAPAIDAANPGIGAPALRGHAPPRADLPPCPGEIVRAQHTARQSTFIVRLPSQAVPSAVAPGWSSGPVTLEQLTIAYLKTSAKPSRVLEAAV